MVETVGAWRSATSSKHGSEQEFGRGAEGEGFLRRGDFRLNSELAER